MKRYRFHSPIARASAYGSARSGFGHWWVERVTAIALAPLALWLMVSAVMYGGADYKTFVTWLSSPVTVVLMILLIAALFWHSALGLQVIIEDYFHTGAKIYALLAVRFSVCVLAVAGILATLRIAVVEWVAG